MWLDGYKAGIMPGAVFGVAVLGGVVALALTGGADRSATFQSRGALILFGGVGTAVMWTFVFGPILMLLRNVLSKTVPRPELVFMAVLIVAGTFMAILGIRAESPLHGSTALAKVLPVLYGTLMPILFLWFAP